MATKTRWQQLLDERKLRPQTASPAEVSALIEVIDRDLADAAIAGLSADRRFATAYNAALQTARLLIAASGHRLASDAGHHKIAFEAAHHLLGPRAAGLIDYFDLCRRKRNQIDYFYTAVATDTEAEELLEKAAEFRTIALRWIDRRKPGLRG
ncbi:MAG TPA: hypothetical protein VF701_09695 [Thermoanaerobaculia bacterium]